MTFIQIPGGVGATGTALNVIGQDIAPSSLAAFTKASILGHPFNLPIHSSLHGAMSVAEYSLLAGNPFTGATIDADEWTSTVANDGTNVQANGGMRVRTGTTADGSASLTSALYARFMAGRTNHFHATIAHSDSGATNNVREWGLGVSTDKLIFRLSGTTLSIVVRNGGSEIYDVAAASWNGVGAAAPTLTNVNTYEIHYDQAEVVFIVNDVVVHDIKFQGQATNLGGLTQEINMPILLSNTNSSSATTEISMYVGSCSVLGHGKAESSPSKVNITTATTTLIKRGAGILHDIVIGTHATGTIKIYDGLTAVNIFSTIASTTNDPPLNMPIHSTFNIGLTIVTSSSVDITAIFE